MRRTPMFWLSTVAVVLLVGGFVLWRATLSRGAAPAPPTAPHAEPAAAPAPAPVAPLPSATNRAAKRAAPAPVVPAAPAPTVAGPPVDARPTNPEEFSTWDETNLQYGAEQLYALTAAVEPLVRECVDRATSAGKRLTGTAMLTYTAVKHGDKVTVDETGINADKTTLADDSLLTCLHQTAKAMKFEGLPRNANVIYAARSVSLENGKITEYRHATFSYFPP